jgi:hypothetical protein
LNEIVTAALILLVGGWVTFNTSGIKSDLKERIEDLRRNVKDDIDELKAHNTREHQQTGVALKEANTAIHENTARLRELHAWIKSHDNQPI